MNIFIVSERRTGSNLLITSLAQVPAVVGGGELFNHGQHPELIDMSTADLLPWARSRCTLEDSAQHTLAKVQPEQLEELGLTFEEFVDDFPDDFYIVLFRRKLLDQYVSFLRANRSGRWLQRHREPGDPKTTTAPVEVTPSDFRAFAATSDARYRGFLDLLSGRNASHVIVSYDEVVSQINEVVSLLTNYLGVLGPIVEHTLVKQNNTPHEVGVSNFDDIQTLLAEPWALHRFATTLGDTDTSDPVSPPLEETEPATRQRFLILHTARSGSTLLMQLLNSRTDVHCEDDLFSAEDLPEGIDQVDAMTEFYTSDEPADAQFIGCKLKTSEIHDPARFREMVQTLGISILALSRRNVAHRVISFARAIELNDRTGRWNLMTPDSIATEPIRIEPEAFRDLVKIFASHDRQHERLTRSLQRPLIALGYDELCEHPQDEFARVAAFLGLPDPVQVPSKIEVRKHTPTNLDGAVQNANELRIALDETEWSWCLADSTTVKGSSH